MTDEQLAKLVERQDGVETMVSFASITLAYDGAGHEVNEFVIGDAEVALDYTLPVGAIRRRVVNADAERADEVVSVVALKLAAVGEDRFGQMTARPHLAGDLDTVPGAERDLVFCDIIERKHGAQPTRTFKRHGDASDEAAKDVEANIDHWTAYDASAVK